MDKVEEEPEDIQYPPEEELRTAQEIRHNLQSLVDSPGWEYVKRMLENQLKIRQKDLDSPADGMDGMIKKEYITGERAGIMLALGMPVLQLGGVTEEIEALKMQLEEKQDEE